MSRLAPKAGRTGGALALAAGLALALPAALGGCATSDPVHFANGRPGYTIGCPWSANGLGQCYQKAASICTDRGYALRNWQGQPVSFNTMEQAVDADLSGFTAKSILVECNQ